MNKIRVKDTGEILNVAEDSYICGLRRGLEVEFTSDEVEFIADSDVPSDWQAFRREAAKDAMASLIGMGRDDGFKYSPEQVADYAIRYADALIDKLREEKK